MAVSLWLSQVTASSHFPLPSKISSLHCWQKSVGWLMLVLYLYRDHYLSIWVNLLLILLYTWMKHLEQNNFDLENEFFIWFFNYNYLVDYYGIFLGCRYMTGKLLLKLDTIKFIAANHTIISALNYILKKKKKIPLFIWLSMKWIFILIVVTLVYSFLLDYGILHCLILATTAMATQPSGYSDAWIVKMPMGQDWVA